MGKSGGRPSAYTDDTLVCVSSKQSRTRLQPESERRALVNKIIDNGGKMTVVELCDSFGFDVRGSIRALVRNGWLEIVK